MNTLMSSHSCGLLVNHLSWECLHWTNMQASSAETSLSITNMHQHTHKHTPLYVAQDYRPSSGRLFLTNKERCNLHKPEMLSPLINRGVSIHTFSDSTVYAFQFCGLKFNLIFEYICNMYILHWFVKLVWLR